MLWQLQLLLLQEDQVCAGPLAVGTKWGYSAQQRNPRGGQVALADER